MSIMKSFRRKMLGAETPSTQARVLAGHFNADEYLKHRVNRLDLERWQNIGCPAIRVEPILNKKQRREATREERNKAHKRRYLACRSD